MNERVTVVIRDCNEKTAFKMATPNDSDRGSNHSNDVIIKKSRRRRTTTRTRKSVRVSTALDGITY